MTARMRFPATGLLDRVGRVRAALVLMTVIAVVAGGVLTERLLHEGEYRITARFVATPGLYPDNDVDILGVPTGHVESVTPRSGYVDVVLSLPDHVQIPADAKAVLMAPNPVSDRFVELTPAWVPGMTTLAHGAVIGRDRTVVPLELDQVFSSLDTLAKSLGPRGANSKGDLTAALHAFAGLAKGNGADLHTAIATISAALPALTAHPDDLKKLVNGLDALTTTLVSRNGTINSLYGDLATATGQIADERDTLSAAIANLQRGLTQVSTFITANQAHIVGGVKNLNVVLNAIVSEQKSLIQTFDAAPLGFQNFNRAVDPTTPCATVTGSPKDCAALWARLDFTKDAASLVKTYCGDSILYSLLPIIEQNVHLSTATATHTVCGAETGLLQGRNGPAGSPTSPDLDLTHYLASR